MQPTSSFKIAPIIHDDLHLSEIDFSEMLFVHHFLLAEEVKSTETECMPEKIQWKKNR